MERERTVRGGARPGAGRPRGTSRYGEKTTPVRIPEGLLPSVKNMLVHYKDLKAGGLDRGPFLPATSVAGPPMPLPLYLSRVAAGFPSPADDFLEDHLDLNSYLVKHPAATFFVRVEGDSMTGAGIHPDDIIVVDRSIEPREGKVIVAAFNGELTVKRLGFRNGRPLLLPENPAYAPIPVGEGSEFTIWGVVTNVIHRV